MQLQQAEGPSMFPSAAARSDTVPQVLSAQYAGCCLVKATTDEMMSFWRRTCHGSNVKDSRKDRRQS